MYKYPLIVLIVFQGYFSSFYSLHFCFHFELSYKSVVCQDYVITFIPNHINAFDRFKHFKHSVSLQSCSSRYGCLVKLRSVDFIHFYHGRKSQAQLYCNK